jgi:hypothetical protein
VPRTHLLPGADRAMLPAQGHHQGATVSSLLLGLSIHVILYNMVFISWSCFVKGHMLVSP